LLRERSHGRIWDIDTGHDLMLTEPEWVANKLVEIATATGQRVRPSDLYRGTTILLFEDGRRPVSQHKLTKLREFTVLG
jgi:hypothetical protein